MKTARLICVTGNNNNKFYNMNMSSDGSISIEYGRIGQEGRKVNYPSGSKNWDTLLNSKIKKGYKDVTEMVQDIQKNDGDLFNGISQSEVKDVLKYLTDCSKQVIKKNYLVSIDNVTEIQIEEAQNIINDLVTYLRLNGNVDLINSKLLKLYTVLPRRMKKVNDYLVDSLSTKSNVDYVRKMIDNEQSLLSTLSSQVNKVTTNSNTSGNILDQMGIDIEVETDAKMLKTIKGYLGKNVRFMKNIYKVTNHSTQKSFDDNLSKAKNKDTMLLWHGSRNENWVGIMKEGLKVRPSNAIITGAMFGNGLYFANRAQKSLGYSSLSGSYWANGNSNKGFLALFSVHTGNMKHINKHDSSCYKLHKTIGNHDSVFAHKGVDLRNDEIITYKTESATISYLIEMEK